jgi:D-serine deaminase-like pyridoxal phosphate-dependent protein
MKDQKNEDPWFNIRDIENVSSPSLILYPARIEANIRKMLTIAGNPDRIRPHIKTHKMPGIVRLMMKYGIYKIKCATIAEAEMAALCGINDILLAIQPVGPNLERFFLLKQKFPETKISCIVDSEEVIIQIWRMANLKKLETHLWIDINNGMNRTGISPDERALLLYNTILSLPMLQAEGLHVYDGHIHEKEISLRKKICDDAYGKVADLIEKIKSSGVSNVNVIAGGTPTFPIHATREGVETSPGTILLMDYGYSSSYADLNFLHAAILFTRIISKPGKDLICIDLGTKAVASEMPQPRIKITGLEKYEILGHNEEHMVIRTTECEKYKNGDPLYCIPWHICPTVDRYDTVYISEDNNITGTWEVEARKRKISI